MKLKIYEFSIFLKILYFASTGTLNIPESVIGRVLQLYTMEPAVINIAFTSV